MHKIVSILFFIVPSIVTAQQFQLIRGEAVTTHSVHDTLGVVDIDSTRIIGQDTIHYFGYITKTANNLPGNCAVKTDSIPWMGKQAIIKGKTNNLFINKEGDTINFNILFIVPEFNFGASRVIYRFPNGDRIRATVVGDEYIQQHGVYKRTKTLELSVEDAQGGSVIHPMDGRDIRIHENFGFEKIYSMWRFPSDTTPIYLEGNSRYGFGATEMRSSDIFNIQPGHERHYLTNYEVCGFPGCREVETREKLFTLARDTSAGGDTLLITHQRTRVQFIDDPVSGIDTTFLQDTMVQEIVWADWHFIDHRPNTWFNYAPSIDGYSFAYRTDTTGPRFIKELVLDYTHDPTNNCLIPNQQASNLPEWRFGDGLGTFYYKHDTAGFSNVEKQLVYYQRGIDKWGTPFQFGPYVGTNANFWQAISLYPNPSSSSCLISGLPSGRVHVGIYSLDGRLVHQKLVVEGHVQIDLTTLAAGLYIVKLTHGDDQHTMKLIKN